MESTTSDGQRFFDTLSTFSTVLAVKLYRLQLDSESRVPVLPCLDHEAMLHEGIDPHAAAYIEDRDGDLHEVVFIPATQRLDVEVASTMGECSVASQERFIENLKRSFPNHAVRLVHPSRLRGGYRVVSACRAQVSLRDVLMGVDLDRTKAAVDRLQTRSRRDQRECCLHFRDGAEAITRSVDKQRGNPEIREMRRAQLLRLVRRMQRIRQ